MRRRPANKRKNLLEELQLFLDEEPTRRKKGRFEKIHLDLSLITPCPELDIKRDKVEMKLRKKFLEECPVGWEVDHIVPKKKGGTDYLENLQWLPKYLNHVKRDYLFFGDCEYPHCLVNIKEKLSEMALRKFNVECQK